MNRVLISLTARQLLGRRRAALIGFVVALPVLIAVIYRVSDEAGRDTTTEEFAIGLVGTLIVTLEGASPAPAPHTDSDWIRFAAAA